MIASSYALENGTGPSYETIIEAVDTIIIERTGKRAIGFGLMVDVGNLEVKKADFQPYD